MNKSLTAAIVFFLGVTLVSISVPSGEAEAGFRRRCCGGGRARCHGLHRHRHVSRCCGGHYDGGCHGGAYSVGCDGHYDHHSNEAGVVPEDQYLAPPDEPVAPKADQPPVVDPEVNANVNANVKAEAVSPSDVDTPPGPPLPGSTEAAPLLP